MRASIKKILWLCAGIVFLSSQMSNDNPRFITLPIGQQGQQHFLGSYLKHTHTPDSQNPRPLMGTDVAGIGRI